MVFIEKNLMIICILYTTLLYSSHGLKIVFFPQQLQQSRQHQLGEDERQCRSYMTLANETVAVFHCLTKEIKEPFLRPVCLYYNNIRSTVVFEFLFLLSL